MEEYAIATYPNILIFLRSRRAAGTGRNCNSLKNGFLYEEPNFPLKDEVASAVNYFSIIRAMADENYKLGKIADALGTGTSALTPDLFALSDLGFVAKKTLITENSEKSRKGRSFISDHFARFWFRYIYLYDMRLSPHPVFHRLCCWAFNQSPIESCSDRRQFRGGTQVVDLGQLFSRNSQLFADALEGDSVLAGQQGQIPPVEQHQIAVFLLATLLLWNLHVTHDAVGLQEPFAADSVLALLGRQQGESAVGNILCCGLVADVPADMQTSPRPSPDYRVSFSATLERNSRRRR